ncbi:MAG: hypothetical protein ACF8Q5_06495 [Phycisphaerales bacterium JB040]
MRCGVLATVCVLGCLGSRGLTPPPPPAEAGRGSAERSDEQRQRPPGPVGRDGFDRSRDDSDRRDRDRFDLESLEPSELRARLERRLEFVREQERRMELALGVLDRGGSVSEAVRVSREGLPEGEPERAEMRDRITDRDRARFMALLQEHVPGLHERLAELRAERPEAADEMLARMGGLLLDAVREKMADDELGTARLNELRASWGVLDVVHRIRTAIENEGDEAARRLRPELERAIAIQLRAKTELANLELARLREQVAELESRSLLTVSTDDATVSALADRITERAVRRGEGKTHRRGEGRPPAGEPKPQPTSTPSGG